MILFIAMLLILLGIISLILCIYNIYCIWGINKLKKNVNKHGKEGLEKSPKFNIFTFFIKKSKKVNNADKNSIKGIVKRKSLLCIVIATTLFSNFLYSAFYCTTIGLICYNINEQINTVTSVMQTLFGNDDDCPCYAKCTDDADDDKESVYKLLFGQTEYDKLVNDMKTSLTQQSIEDFDKINDGESGKDKSEFIKNNINDDMVYDYKNLVGNNSKFRKEDGLDRSKMSFDELRTDLYNLLCDYKINGRNPNCDCQDAAHIQIKYKCLGENHYKEGWSWTDIWEEDDKDANANTSSNQNNGPINTPGHATGKYALTLDDGVYYWYHQSNRCKCNYDPKTSNGYFSDIHPGGINKDTAGSRACSMYSTSIALSNLLGEEITPWVLLSDVMKCKVESSGGVLYFKSSSKNGIDFCNSAGVVMDMSELAKLINKAYGSKGIEAEVIDFKKAEIDKYLDDSSMYAYVINSWGSSSLKAAGGDSEFPWYKGSGHFMVIRGKDSSGNYKCFTSASSYYGSTHDLIAKGMNKGASWDKVSAYVRHSKCIVIHRDTSYYNTQSSNNSANNGGSVLGYNEEVYNILKNNSTYKSKALALAAAYAALEPDYGKNFTLGVMANIASEGNFGLFEGIWNSSSGKVLTCDNHNGIRTYAYWKPLPEEVHNINYKVVNANTIDILISNLHDYETSGPGIGICGWSTKGRRAGILDMYKANCTTYSQEELGLCEIKYMQKEFKGNSKKVVNACKGKSEAECASYVCLQYEIPDNKYKQAEKRAQKAVELKNLLSSVTTHGATSSDNSNNNNSNNNNSNNNNSNNNNSNNNNNNNSNNNNNNNNNNSNNSSKTKGEQAVEYARTFVGCHYVMSGNTMGCKDWTDNKGVDCSHFVTAVLEHYGYKGGYARSGGWRSKGEKVNYTSEADLKPGDVICYSGHVALYDGNGKIVEAEGKKWGVVNNRKWDKSTVLAVRRVLKD